MWWVYLEGDVRDPRVRPKKIFQKSKKRLDIVIYLWYNMTVNGQRPSGLYRKKEERTMENYEADMEKALRFVRLKKEEYEYAKERLEHVKAHNYPRIVDEEIDAEIATRVYGEVRKMFIQTFGWNPSQAERKLKEPRLNKGCGPDEE